MAERERDEVSQGNAPPRGRTGLDQAMARYADGDDSAFAEVYDELAPRLGAFLLRMTRDAHLTEDLLQQTFLQMHDARGRFTQGAAVTPWAYAIARRLFLDLRKRTGRDDRRHVDLDDYTDTLASTAASPESLLEGKASEQVVERALLAMPETQRTAFLLVKREGLSLQEAAQVLGTTIATVKLRAHRAYERLRAALGDKGDPGEPLNQGDT